MSKRALSGLLAVLVVLLPLLTGQSVRAAEQEAYSAIANPIATTEARNLYYYLQSLGAQDGVVVGAMDTSITTAFPHGNNYDLLNETFGVKPGMYSTRYYWTSSWNTTWPQVEGNALPPRIGFALEQADSESGASAAKRVNDVLYEHYQAGAILLIHADSMEPKAVGELLYKNGKVELAETKDTDYDDAILYVDKSNPDRDMEASALFWGYVEQWADALEDLESRGVAAYLFRPFVEMNSKDFYGCTDEGRAAFRRVWQQMYDYFYRERGLKGCLLDFAPADYMLDTRSAQPFYPGNSYVDVLSPTRYTDAAGKFDPPSQSNYSWMVSTGKPLGFSEFSVRQGDWKVASAAPLGDWNYALKVLLKNYPKVSFVNTWAGTAYSLYPPDASGGGNHNGEYFLKSPYTLLAEDLPDFSTAAFSKPAIVQFYTGKGYQGSCRGWDSTGDYSIAAWQGAGIDLSDVGAIRLQRGYGLVFFSEENGQGTAWPALGSIADFAGLGIAGRIRSFRLVELTENVALDKEVTGSDGTGDEVWKINDGLASRWISEEAVGAWLCIDLETPYWLNRYAVRHAGTAGEDALYNTSAFTIQCSTDGQQWTTVSTVLGNVDDMTDETVAPFKAQYVRLRIDRPNSSRFEPDRGCIVEFELYGLPAYENEGPVIGDAPMDDPQWQPSEEESAQGDSTESSDEETPSPTKRKLVKKTVITRDNLWILWVGIGVGAAILAAVLVLVIRKKKKAASANDQPERSEEA